MSRARRRIVTATLSILALVAAAPAPAAPAAPAPFLAALAEFERGLAGDGSANQRARDRFQELLEGEPANPLYLAYLGSSFAIMGRDAWAPWSKLRHTEKGLALLDKALALLTPAHDQETVRGVPVSQEVRLNAAVTFLAVPGFMHRTAAARLVLSDALSSPAFAATPGRVQARLLLQDARLAQRDEKPAEEVEALQRALAAWPDGATATQARTRLKELGQ
jgi:hypothetical protein